MVLGHASSNEDQRDGAKARGRGRDFDVVIPWYCISRSQPMHACPRPEANDMRESGSSRRQGYQKKRRYADRPAATQLLWRNQDPYANACICRCHCSRSSFRACPESSPSPEPSLSLTAPALAFKKRTPGRWGFAPRVVDPSRPLSGSFPR